MRWLLKIEHESGIIYTEAVTGETAEQAFRRWKSIYASSLCNPKLIDSLEAEYS